ncbi:hypothetical protein [Bradyrhizobium elkanii]|uniref:hypothetical protein n=1 Tax=Bradyrhizobium elkanii TaxID=29448 RepID=UPI001BA5EBBA|nr:hypothetical protein [Bradyrhizobium elkanii]MBR1165259.1 hypothetical protein [Bradyrhizobium elkanii]
MLRIVAIACRHRSFFVLAREFVKWAAVWKRSTGSTNACTLEGGLQARALLFPALVVDPKLIFQHVDLSANLGYAPLVSFARYIQSPLRFLHRDLPALAQSAARGLLLCSLAISVPLPTP